MLNLGTKFRTNSILTTKLQFRVASLCALLISLCGPTGCAIGSPNFFGNEPLCESHIVVPTLTSISPSQARTHIAVFNLELTGRDFDQRTFVFFNGFEVQTTHISATNLQALITTDLLRTEETVGVHVVKAPENGSVCGDGTSNTLNFFVSN